MKNYLSKIIKGDCRKVMASMPKNSVNLIVTDPPYNASAKGVNLVNNKTGGAYYKVNEKWDKFGDYSNYIKFTKEWITEADRLLKPNGSIMVCGSFHSIGEVILILKERGYKFLNFITWEKANPMPNITKRMLTHSTEFIVWFAKGKGWTFNYEEMKKYNDGKQLRDVWKFPICQGAERVKGKDGRAAHPMQKPLKIIERLIEMASNKKDIVLDPFMGCGTTAIASEKLGRKWIGIEKEQKYITLANKRIKASRKK